VLVTDDLGLRVKARGHGIEAINLPDGLKLPDEPDPSEKRVKELEREILELKRVVPEPRLTFDNGSDHLEVRLEPPVSFSREELEREKKLIRLKHKKWGEARAEEAKAAGQGLAGLNLRDLFADVANAPSKDAIERYNAEMERFYTNFDRWLADKSEVLSWQRRTVCLSLVLTNSGTEPARDIDLFLDFPEGFEIYDKATLPRMPPEPTPPEKPQSGLAEVASILSPNLIVPRLADSTRRDTVPRNVSGPLIQQTDGYEVRFHVDQAKHELRTALGYLYVVFPSYEAAASFGIEYRIVAGNVRKPVPGKLHVIVNK
jgi:hypothetical protein